MTAILALFLPGLLLSLSREMEKKGPSEVLAYSIFASLSFFIVSSWMIKYIAFSLQGFTFTVLIVSLIMILMRSKDLLRFLTRIDKEEALILFSFMIVILLRLLPAIFQIAPAGAEMSMQSYVARLIFDSDRIPSSYEPLFPTSHFGAFPTGFPVLTAIFSLISNIPIYRSALYLALFVHALIPVGLFAVLLMFFDKRTSLIGAISSSFLLRDPQWMIRWGGNSAVLAMFFFLISVSLLVKMQREGTYLQAFLLALSVVSILFCHAGIFCAGACILTAIWLYNSRDIKAKWRLWAAATCMAILMAVPYIISLRSLTKSAAALTKVWQITDLKVAFYDLIVGMPFIIICIAGAILLNKKEKKLLRLCSLLILVTAVILIAQKLSIFPISNLLSPGGIALLLILPFSILAAPALKNLTEKSRAICVFLAILGISYYMAFYAVNSILKCSVTPADMKAFDWMDTTLGKRAVIMNNYGDAGLWIPAIIGRTITKPHSEPIYSEELYGNLKKVKAGYIYIGSKRVYDDIDIDKEYLEKRPWRYKRLYSQDGAQVWKILY